MDLQLPGPAAQRSTAVAMDAADPLADFRHEFVIQDPDICYLDGNSLGRLPKETVESVRQFLLQEWGPELVDGWSHWIDEAQVAGDLLARATLGTGPGQTLVCDTTSVNFYQLCSAAIAARPGRSTVVIDAANFPTDRYILAGIAASLGLTLVTLDNDGSGGPGAVGVDTQHERITPEVLAPLLSDDIALVSLQAIHYRSGARPDIKGITDLVRSHGGLVVWDCSHAGGAVRLDFDANGVDLAVGCTYKYGNSGPGAPAWLFVRKKLQSQLRVPIQGWFAQEDQFAMGPLFEPTDTIRRFQVASPSIIGIRSVQTAYSMIERAGIDRIEAKAALGTELMVQLFDAWLSDLGFSLGTSRAWHERGGHIYVKHPEARRIASAMRTVSKVIPDYREPGGIRLAISPLPTSFVEVWDGFDRLRNLVASGSYESNDPEKSRVT
jgi:kynureninase